MRKKLLLTIVSSVLVLAGIAAIVIWRWMGRPLYQPGAVRDQVNLRGSLVPPPQPEGDSYWLVEEDIKLHYHADGQGRPVLVVHGGPGYPIHWPLVGLQPLTGDFKFYYYDQRGCGRSTRPFERFESRNYYASMTELERTLGVGAQVADIERIRRILGEEKLILIGLSFGGFLSSLYAAEFPENVAAMILVAPAGMLLAPAEQGDIFQEIRARLPAGRQLEYDEFLAEYLNFGNVFSKTESQLAAANRRVGEFFLEASGTSTHSLVDTDNGGWMVQAMYFSLGMRRDYRSALKQVPAPVLILHGADDLAPQEASRIYAASLPHARLEIVSAARPGDDRSGHFVYDDRPDVFAELVAAFLASVTD